MRFEDTKYSKEYEFKKLEFPFGNFYLCDLFFVAELNEGEHFEWEKINSVMSKVIEHYGNNVKLGYISNRINSYSMDPYSWKKVDKKY